MRWRGDNANAPKWVKATQSYWEATASIFGDPRQAKPLLLTGLAGLIITLIALVYLFINVPNANALTRDVGELRLLSQQVSRYATEASVSGEAAAAQHLKVAQDQFNVRLEAVHDIYGDSSEAIQQVDDLWGNIDNRVSLILSQQKTVNSLYDIGVSIAEAIPDVQAEYNIVVDGLVRADAPNSQVALAKNQVWLAERILRSVNSVLTGDEASVASADDFSTDAEDFGRYLNGQLRGDAELGVERINDAGLRSSLQSIQETYNDVIKVAASRVLVNSPQIIQVREAAGKVFNDSDSMLGKLDSLSSSINSRYNIANIGVAAVFILGLGLIAYALNRLFNLRSKLDIDRAHRIQEENEQNQTAILRLLDELGDLADGDLTTNATVSEDFTGAIADSINFAIDQLRELVSRINSTSAQVADYSQETQSLAMQLADSSEHQAQEIAGASAAINEMAVSIDQVSANAMESAAVAERSVDIAYTGADVVQRTIEGMDMIREQIQETSKRIKRLGESSQEIGDIVSLINDIADQTNILALNAAIQASMAGEAGRGFAVVADEVQRLAERSAAATKQIEGLVKTIQSDTNEAVISMEQTTSEVVRGAHLAKDAGVALEEVQTVSRTLADLIQNISDAARQQAASAGHISSTMNVIQDITTQTTAGTINTAKSVGDLANMAVELRASVSDFKLPEDM
ncbi:methyl-accepting chemotaxis protein [Alkanindiges sp. WGS2144]|uniref:methyl-accepting chemotaxis protein n=1 Tax=Alkanindiges sp. WGS2144 TaxID=3366808 RepID=UPI0037510D95